MYTLYGMHGAVADVKVLQTNACVWTAHRTPAGDISPWVWQSE